MVMVAQTLQFSFQKGSELLESLTEFSRLAKTGYWRFQFDYFTKRNQGESYWYLGVLDGHLFCSYSSVWNAENLAKTLFRYIPPAQQSELKIYLNSLNQSGQLATLPPTKIVSHILSKGWIHQWQIETALRTKVLVDMDTYLTLGAGQAEFIQDDTLASELPFKGSLAGDLERVALERLSNWQKFKRFLPSMNLVPTLNTENFLQAGLSVGQRQWIEQQVKRQQPLSRIAAISGQDPLEIAKTFAKLAHAGIIQLVSPEQLVKPTIMVIDDSPMVLRQFQQWLGTLGYSVILCQHANQAIHTIRQTKPNLIFIDINMPQISGFDLVKQIRMEPDIARTPVVILTAEQKLSNKWRAQWSNCEFLTKPLSAEDTQTFASQLHPFIQNLLADTTLSALREAS
jgi:CheY-like chemotaxis protein